MNGKLASLLAVLALATAAAPAQQAAFAILPGTGCTLLGQPLAMSNTGLPVLGQSFRINYSGPNTTFNSGQQITQPFFAIGTVPALFPIPMRLFPNQPAGCIGFVQPENMFAMPTDPNGRPIYQAWIDLPVPNDPALAGAQLLAQWVVIHQQCGIAGCGIDAVGVSDVGQITVGL